LSLFTAYFVCEQVEVETDARGVRELRKAKKKTSPSITVA
jgi:hypothetical protein